MYGHDKTMLINQSNECCMGFIIVILWGKSNAFKKRNRTNLIAKTVVTENHN